MLLKDSKPKLGAIALGRGCGRVCGVHGVRAQAEQRQ